MGAPRRKNVHHHPATSKQKRRNALYADPPLRRLCGAAKNICIYIYMCVFLSTTITEKRKKERCGSAVDKTLMVNRARRKAEEEEGMEEREGECVVEGRGGGPERHVLLLQYCTGPASATVHSLSLADITIECVCVCVEFEGNENARGREGAAPSHK
jgi:hypothetical protein